MVKYLVPSIHSTSKYKIPLKLLIFYYKRISSYIRTRNLNLFTNKEFPTIYISKKYPNMSILELHQRISHHLIKYYPSIYEKLNSNSKKCIVKLKKEPIGTIENEIINESSKNIIYNKNAYVLINLGIKNKLSEKIKLSNEKNCEKIKHLFQPHIFNDDICEKYNNCSVKEILLEENNNNIDDESSSNDLDNVSPCKTISTYSSSIIIPNNKINFLTHFKNAPRKSKYFNNDDYYSNKLKSLGN